LNSRERLVFEGYTEHIFDVVGWSFNNTVLSHSGKYLTISIKLFRKIIPTVCSNPFDGCRAACLKGKKQPREVNSPLRGQFCRPVFEE